MSVNNLYHLDSNLKNYYRYELDWVLLPESLRKVSIHLRPFCLSFFTKITIECYLNSNLSVVFFQMCSLFAKALKQRDYSILFDLIALTSFCMEQACVNVQNAFWKEPVIIWIAFVITTGTLLVLKTKPNLTLNQTGTIIGELIPNQNLF